jgi:hypothetical protein
MSVPPVMTAQIAHQIYLQWFKTEDTAVSNNNPIPNNKPFKKGQSGNPKGRPKNVETLLKEHFLDEHNVKLSKGQVQDIIKNVLGKSRSELVELAKNDELPFWIALIAKKAQRDYEKGSIHILDVLFDRVYGKPERGGRADRQRWQA